jgi:hypothetical protein
VIVEETLETESINSIKFDDLMKVKDVVKASSMNIYGNVNVEKLIVDGTLNQKLSKILSDLYSYDAPSYTHHVNTDVHFNQPTSVNSLNTPMLNKINVNEWIANMIRSSDSNVYITSEKTFMNQLLAQQGFYCDVFNDIKMVFLDRIVFANEPSSIVNIDGDLIFADDVYSQLVGLRGDLNTRFISSCDVQKWLYYALPIDRDVLLNGEFYDLLLNKFLLFQLSGALHVNSSAFKPKQFTARYLNGFNLNDVFTLHTNQTFTNSIGVEKLEVKEPLIVHELVNGLNLEHERGNTVVVRESFNIA